MCAKRSVTISDDVAGIIDHLPLRQAIPKLEVITLKALRAVYLTAMKPLAGE
jgi:hypothetical protein